MKTDAENQYSLSIPCRVGILIILITFGGFGLWTLTAPLQSAALALGKVVVKGSRKSIEHFEGGIVAELAVSEGDTVEAGDLLIRLNDTQASAELEISTGQHYAILAQEARLRAERGNEAAVHYPQLIEESNDPRAIDAIVSQNQVFRSSRSARLGETDVLQQRVAQLQEQIKGTEVFNASKQALADSYAWEIRDLSALLADGFTDKQRLRELERAQLETLGELAEASAAIAQQHIQVGEARMQILQVEKEFHNRVVDQLSKTQVERYDLEERIRAADDRLDRTRVFSPVSGVVVGMALTTLGEVVSPAEPLLYVVPQSGALIIHARVKPIDIDRVREGQSADIRFSAFSSPETAVIPGNISSVSADALTDEQLGTSYYLAQIEVTPDGLDRLENFTLIPGMPAEVLINTGSRTLFQYLSQPIRNAFARSLIER